MLSLDVAEVYIMLELLRVFRLQRKDYVRYSSV